MIRVNGKSGGFTLIELLVVISMIVIIIGALTTSVEAAYRRARTQKALNDVKVISQAILAYENFKQGGSYTLPTLKDADAEANTLGFLIGDGGGSTASGKIPVLLQAAFAGGDKIRDPWGTPYKVTIQPGSYNLRLKTVTGSLSTGYFLPNLYLNGGEE